MSTAASRVERDIEERVAECFLNPGPFRVVIEEDGFKYSGALIIPETAKRRPTTGTVIKVGSGITLDFLEPGRRILYGQFSGTLVEFKNRPAYRILSQDEVLAEITKTDAELSDTYA